MTIKELLEARLTQVREDIVENEDQVRRYGEWVREAQAKLDQNREEEVALVKALSEDAVVA